MAENNTILEKLEGLVARFEEVSTLITDPNVIGDQKRYVKLTKEYKELGDIMAARKEYLQCLNGLEEAKMMMAENDPEMKEMAREEAAACEARIPQLEEEIKLLLVPADPQDDRNAILEIRGGTGGDEAAIFAGDLFRMYSKYCESKGWKTVDGVIVFDTPAREPGQKSVLGLKTAPMETVRVGFIGLGMRGPGAVERFTHLDGVEIKALCDLYPERVDSAQAILVRRGFPEAAPYSGEEGWKQLCERDDIDLVYIVTPWQLHVPMAVYAMEHGKHVAVEVPAATSLDECWQFPNFVISSGCDIPAQSSWDNIDAFFNAVDEFYTNKNM